MEGNGQYFLYTGDKLATPRPSTVPLATIGGEPGGRAPIVVEDKHADVPGGRNDDQTSAMMGMAQPGHDVFAGGPNAAGKSTDAQPSAQVTFIEEKVISKVDTLPGGGDSRKASELHAQSDDVRQQSSTVENSDREGESSGLFAEADLVAEAAAKELYPDDVH